MYKIKSVFDNLKLREKIIIANILVLALPIVVISFIIFQDIRDETIDEVVLNARYEVNNVVRDISYQIEKMINIEEFTFLEGVERDIDANNLCFFTIIPK